MSILTEIRDAGAGWLDMLAGRPEGGARFNRSGRGLANAIGFYVFIVLAAVFVPAGTAGFPGIGQVLLGIGFNMLPLAGIVLVTWATVRLLGVLAGVNTLLVPAVYAMGFILLIGLPLSAVFGGNFGNAMLGVLAYALFRVARDIGGLGAGVSISFALLTIAVLVALPMGLYMVTMPAIPAS